MEQANEAEHPPSPKIGSGAAPRKGKLYVIMHGLFCFFELEQEILVRVPIINHGMNGSMGCNKCFSEHVYRAGNWMGETILEPGEHALINVIPGRWHLDANANLLIDGAQPAHNPDGLYAEIHLPYPKWILSLRRFEFDPREYFAGPDFWRIRNRKALSTIQIFEYEFENQYKLELTDHLWRVDRVMEHDVCVLHVFSEPDVRKFKGMPPGTHFNLAFQSSLRMFDNIRLSVIKPFGKLGEITERLPEHLVIQELEDYSIRLERLQVLGALRRHPCEENLNQIWDPDPFINQSDTERCGGTGT